MEINENVSIVNLVYRFNVGSKVNLEALAQEHMKDAGVDVCYEPEDFPGVRYIIYDGGSVLRGKKGKGKKVSCLVFNSGDVIVAGCKTFEKVNETYSIIKNVVEMYKVHNGGE